MKDINYDILFAVDVVDDNGEIMAINDKPITKVVLGRTNEYKIFELNFYEGIINNIKCILVESGVGKVNAARTTQILIDNMDVDCIFNIGVAGGLAQDLNVLDIVVADKLVQHDFDITAFNHEKGYIPNVGKYINCDEYLLSIAKNSNKVGRRRTSDPGSGCHPCPRNRFPWLWRRSEAISPAAGTDPHWVPGDRRCRRGSPSAPGQTRHGFFRGSIPDICSYLFPPQPRYTETRSRMRLTLSSMEIMPRR